MQHFSNDDTNVAGEHLPFLSRERTAHDPARLLAEMRFSERRTALLVHSALIHSGCDGATIRLVQQYLWAAGVFPLLTDLRVHCAFTFAHSLRTMDFVVKIAGLMGVETSEHAILFVGALLHDIGKLWVPISILQKPESLRNSEFETIRTHPEIGYESVADKRIFGWSAVLDIIRHHHECLDGSGYPLGLTAPRISWRARCVSVCDVFCALTENRPYRLAMRTEEALHILREMARAGKLDEDIVGVFCSQHLP